MTRRVEHCGGGGGGETRVRDSVGRLIGDRRNGEAKETGCVSIGRLGDSTRLL